MSLRFRYLGMHYRESYKGIALLSPLCTAWEPELCGRSIMSYNIMHTNPGQGQLRILVEKCQ